MFWSTYNVYKYLYYRVYAWNLKKWGESDMPQFSALFLVLIFMFMNTMSILTAVEILAGGSLIEDQSSEQLILGGLALTISLTSYFLLVHRGKYKRIVADFCDESVTQRRVGLAAIWVYITSSFIAFFGLISMLHRLKV
jgi:uncharacterized membrane protein